MDRKPGFRKEIEVIRRNPENGVGENSEASATPAELRWKGVRVRVSVVSGRRRRDAIRSFLTSQLCMLFLMKLVADAS